MAKGKYEEWLTEEGITLLEGWARDGLTDEQIAKNMGVSRSTLHDWKKKYPDISDTLKKGKEVVDYQVENALLESALSGNVTAIIFWLKNRRSDKWRDKPPEQQKNASENNLLQAIRQSIETLSEGEEETPCIMTDSAENS